MPESESWFLQELETRGVSRRDFMSFCSAIAAVLALPRTAAARIAAEIGKTEKPVLVWLEFQDCAGNTESFLRASRPTAAEIVLDTLSVDYHETIMAAAGHQAEEALAKTVKEKAGKYLAVVEGSIPTGANGAYCTIGGRSALQIAREVCGQAAATIAMGTCATFGGLPAAAPNPTGALGVADAVPGVKNLINLSACPANVENLTALIVYFLTFKRWPPLTAGAGPSLPTGSPSTTTASGALTSTPASTWRASATRATAPGTASTRWAARGPSPSRTAPTCAGTAAPTGRSAAGTRASAVRSRISGTR